MFRASRSLTPVTCATVVSKSIFPSPLAVHHLWDSVHCDRSQHNQKNSKFSFDLTEKSTKCRLFLILISLSLCEKQVTVSLALSIVTLLGICWTLLHIIPNIQHSHYWHFRYPAEYFDGNDTETLMFWASNYNVSIVFILWLLLICCRWDALKYLAQF